MIKQTAVSRDTVRFSTGDENTPVSLIIDARRPFAVEYRGRIVARGEGWPEDANRLMLETARAQWGDHIETVQDCTMLGYQVIGGPDIEEIAP